MTRFYAGAAVLLAVTAAGCTDKSAFGGGGNTEPAKSIYLNAIPPGANGNSAGGVGEPQGVPFLSPEHYDDQLALYGDLAYAIQGLKADPCIPPTQASEHLQKSDLVCNYYKHAGLRPDTIAGTPIALSYTREENGASKTSAATIIRDGWGVPYIEGEDRLAAAFAFGYASAQDRLWLHDLLRNIGRGRFSEYLGPAKDTYDFDNDLALVAGYSEDELTAMADNARAKFGALGDVILADLDAVVAGINDYIGTLQGPAFSAIPPEYATLAAQVPPAGLPKFPPREWTRNDIVASAILIQSIFAVGGGGEHENLELLQHLDPQLLPGAAAVGAAACSLWRDLRHADDPDTPRTIDAVFATQSPAAVDETCPQPLPAGAAIWDRDSFQKRQALQHPAGGGLPLLGKASAPRGKAAARRPAKRVLRDGDARDPFEGVRQALGRVGMPIPRRMSNFIAVNADQTAEGYPIAVMGPQAGYFLPQLLWEVSVVSNGGTDLDFAGRGVVFGDLPYINIGRGPNFAFSATSGGSDVIDVRVSRLCNLADSALGAAPSRDDARNNATGADGADGFPDADGYLFDAGDGQGVRCRRFYQRADAWTANPTAASLALGCASDPQDENCYSSAQTVERKILRTHYGPVLGTATVAGAPVAVSIQRSTFFGELETAPPFALATTRTIKTPADFLRVFNSVTGTFNWLYVDNANVGYLHSGLYPVRHVQAHPELPVWGDGRFEWQSTRALPAGFFDSFGGDDSADGDDDEDTTDAEGPIKAFPNLATPVAQGDPLRGFFEWQDYLPQAAHPQAINPPRGHIHSWNNSPAQGWWAADANGSFGTTHRADMLHQRLEAFQASGRRHDIATMGEIAADAAFQDLRGQEVLPLLLQILDQQKSSPGLKKLPDLPALALVTGLMQQWLDDGSHQWLGPVADGRKFGAYRRDRDASGTYDQRAAVVLMDAWYQELIKTVIPQVQAIAEAGFSPLQGAYDAPRAQGSAYQFGWFQHMKRVLQMALDTPGHTPYRALRCAGSANPAACRDAVLAALDNALVLVDGDTDGLSDAGDGFAAWNQAWDGTELPNHKSAGPMLVEDYDAVEHTSVSLFAVPAIDWINRPTFQQLVQVKQAE